MRGFLLGIIFTVVALLIAGWLLAQSGVVDFRADQEPSAFETKAAMKAVDASTDRHAAKIANPLSASEENIVAGAKLYLDNCAGCHGVPSNPDSQFGHYFYPPVPQFFTDTPDMSENENFYIIQHGIRWTGMPAWDKTLSVNQRWQLVTFLSSIGKLPASAQKVFQESAAAAQTPKQ